MGKVRAGVTFVSISSMLPVHGALGPLILSTKLRKRRGCASPSYAEGRAKDRTDVIH